ncbi:uncharacterized protein LOC120720599 [Simochromis diagramma]|uniref:uncharacterized protein LOC120720599 n=1 Tax=Simochromis diagramma TaxID=43689 RepID=UPI001A7EA870|nr:uncharacterized protein LOC120720599 [Simochromis diagramma]
MAESNNGSNNTTPQYQGNGAVESAVRNLVSLLLNNISTNPSGRPTESGQPEPRNLTIQQEMTRSFPGYFKSHLSRGKKRCLTSTKQLVKAGSKTTGLSFYLLSKNTSYTPLPAEELELLQAGMGRQTVSLPEDGDHAEISRLLEETFPKMEYLCGGWLLHKATGLLLIQFLCIFCMKDMISGIESRFFEGLENKGKNPKYSLTDLDNENFRTVGEIIAVSLAQGGPSPAFFKEWCYNFLCSGEVDFSCLSKEDVADVESSLLIRKVEDAADIQSLMMWADEIVSCGYTNQIKMESKESMIRAIVLHSTTRLIPMLQQLRKGIELYGLVNLMAVNPEACHSLFVPGKILKPDADFIMMSCQPHFSEKGTSRERTERKIINFLQDFLQEIEVSEKTSETFSNITDGNTGGAGGEKSESLAVHHVLQWMTGQSHVPILPDEKRHFKITCKFDHECKERLGDHSICYPVVSACTCTVTFPVQHLDTYTVFKTIMSAAVKYGGGFHRV